MDLEQQPSAAVLEPRREVYVPQRAGPVERLATGRRPSARSNRAERQLGAGSPSAVTWRATSNAGSSTHVGSASRQRLEAPAAGGSAARDAGARLPSRAAPRESGAGDPRRGSNSPLHATCMCALRCLDPQERAVEGRQPRAQRKDHPAPRGPMSFDTGPKFEPNKYRPRGPGPETVRPGTCGTGTRPMGETRPEISDLCLKTRPHRRLAWRAFRNCDLRGLVPGGKEERSMRRRYLEDEPCSVSACCWPCRRWRWRRTGPTARGRRLEPEHHLGDRGGRARDVHAGGLRLPRDRLLAHEERRHGDREDPDELLDRLDLLLGGRLRAGLRRRGDDRGRLRVLPGRELGAGGGGAADPVPGDLRHQPRGVPVLPVRVLRRVAGDRLGHDAGADQVRRLRHLRGHLRVGALPDHQPLDLRWRLAAGERRDAGLRRFDGGPPDRSDRRPGGAVAARPADRQVRARRQAAARSPVTRCRWSASAC